MFGEKDVVGNFRLHMNLPISYLGLVRPFKTLKSMMNYYNQVFHKILIIASMHRIFFGRVDKLFHCPADYTFFFLYMLANANQMGSDNEQSVKTDWLMTSFQRKRRGRCPINTNQYNNIFDLFLGLCALYSLFFV